MEVLGKRLTCQESEADDSSFVFSADPDAYRSEYWNPTAKYMLRGVALTPELAYVCVREPAGLIQVDDAATAPKDQWWKITHTAEDNVPPKVEVRDRLECLLVLPIHYSQKTNALVYRKRVLKTCCMQRERSLSIPYSSTRPKRRWRLRQLRYPIHFEYVTKL